jgi:multicomponent Na+:H+ antiporter subunit D
MWTPELSLALALVLPALGGVFVALLGSRPNLREAATLIAAVLLAFNVAYLVEIAQGHPTLDLATLAPGLHLVFKLEPLGAIFAAVASGLWIVNRSIRSAICAAITRRTRRVSMSVSVSPLPVPWAWPCRAIC